MSPKQNASDASIHRMNKQPYKRINRRGFDDLTPPTYHPSEQLFLLRLIVYGKQSLFITFYYNCLVFKEM